jgi:hypothetical protein
VLLNLNAQSDISSFNNLKVNIEDTCNTYKILVTGHLHGSSNNKSGFPASTLLGNLDLINGGNYAFMVSLGDLFMNPDTDIDNYYKSFFSKLSVPFFNAVGNHDVFGNKYKQHFGNTFFSFAKRTEIFIFLDTEINNGDIISEQLLFLKNELSSIDTINNIFIFMHRPLWAEEHPLMKNIFTDNTRSFLKTNYNTTIHPLLISIPSNKNIFLFAGSMGNAPASFFYHKENNITYVATAIRDLPRDAFLEVILNNSYPDFNTITLTNNPVKPLFDYNLDYYNQNSKSTSFNWRLLPLYIKNMLSNYHFWFGCAVTALFFLIISLFIKRKNRIAKN